MVIFPKYISAKKKVKCSSGGNWLYNYIAFIQWNYQWLNNFLCDDMDIHKNIYILRFKSKVLKLYIIWYYQ